MVPSLTKPSTRRLSEVARHVIIPAGIVSTGWPAVESRCNEWGDSFDSWQSGLGRSILGKRTNLTYAATVGGITMSIPRQVAKTFLVGRIIMALCSLFPRLRVLWTAHHNRTITNTFRALSGFCQRKKVAPFIAGVRSANGEQEIRFINGSIIMFGAREQGFGRGFEEVDIIVFDEAQILSLKALEDMIASTNQSRHVHGALLFYMGTPPRPTDPGEVFTARRTDALATKGRDAADFGQPTVGGDALYVECSADRRIGRPGGPSLDDHGQWRMGNPSFPDRTPFASMLRLRKNLPSDDAWRREGMGVWDENTGTSRYFTADEWNARAVDTAPTVGMRAFGVAYSVDGARVSVGGALNHDDGVHVEVIGTHSGSTADGVASLADWLAARWRTVVAIDIAGPANAQVLLDALRARGVPSRVAHIVTAGDYFASCSSLADAVHDGTLTHPRASDGDALEDSVAVCDKKARTNGAWGWSATTPAGDETPLESVSLALRAAATTKRRPKTGKAVFT